MFLPPMQSINSIKFFRDSKLCVALVKKGSECTNQTANPKYLYRCLTDSKYTLTIPAENMTEEEQHSKWRCEYTFVASFKSREEILDIKSKLNMKILLKLFLTLSISVSLLLCVCVRAHSFAFVCLMYFCIFFI